MCIWMFPGQGSQQKNMGQDLFPHFPVLVDLAEQILDFSIQEVCVRDTNGLLNDTRYTQPALFVVNALFYFKRLKDGFKKPAYFIGHSLGEYNALLAAGFFDFATGLRLVKKRAELMSKVNSGAMAALIGLNANKISEILKLNNFINLTIANYNTPTQVVISGLSSELDQAIKLFKAQNVTIIRLNVSGAFHSPYMQQASEEFQNFLEEFEFKNTSEKVIANVDVELYRVEDIKQKLAKQISFPVLWVDIIKKLISDHEKEFIEVGPGNVLTKLVSQIISSDQDVQC